MELRHLRYFLAVAEELHFARAAERLHIPIGDAPKPELIDRDRSENVADIARDGGYSAEMVMLRRSAGAPRELAVKLPDGRWAYLVFPNLGPFPLWPLIAYLALVALGVVVAIVGGVRERQVQRPG